MAEQFVLRHGAAMLGVARKYSSCAADADDAYQRAIEILLVKAPADATEKDLLAWALTVVRNEALMLQRGSVRVVPMAPGDFENVVAPRARRPDQQLIDSERIGQGREALRKIKPDQLRCLLLRAEGLDYDEIRERTGFSYPKVNRLLSEGRAAFKNRVDRLETGAECRGIAGVLSMIADGVADEETTRNARRHLDHCLVCRATLREYRSAPARIATALPLAIAMTEDARGAGSRYSAALKQVVDGLQSSFASLQQRLGVAATFHQGAEIATVKKLAVIATVSASLVAGGVTAERAIDRRGDAPTVRRSVDQVGSTVDTGAPTATTGAVGPPRSAADAASAADVTPARGARESDVVGDNAAVQVPTAEGHPSTPAGDSVDGPDTYGAPTSGHSGSAGSSQQSADLAP